jgi:hypothetical protein
VSSKEGKTRTRAQAAAATAHITPRGLSTAEAAKYIGMSPEFLRQGRLYGTRNNRTPAPPHLKIARRVIYLRDDLDRWLEAHRQP